MSIGFGIVLGTIVAVVLVPFLVALINSGKISEVNAGSERSHSNKDALQATRITASSLIEIQDISGHFERTVALYELLDSASESDIELILKQSASLSSSVFRQTVHLALIDRVSALDPINALELIETLPADSQAKAVEFLFSEWSHTDLEQAIQESLRLDEDLKSVAFQAIVSTRIDLDDQSRLAIGRRLSKERETVRILRTERVSELKSDLQIAWQSILNDGYGLLLSTDLFIELSDRWFQLDPGGVVNAIIEATRPSPNSFESEKQDLLRIVLQHLVRKKPKLIFEQATGLQHDSKRLHLSVIVEEWARIDPRDALDHVLRYEQDSSFKFFSQKVLKEWANSRPTELWATLPLIPRNLQLKVAEYVVATLARTDRNEARAIVSDWKASGHDTSTLIKNYVLEWSKLDAKGALEWFLSEVDIDDGFQKEVLNLTLDRLAQVDPHLALELALEHGDKEERFRPLESNVVRSALDVGVEDAISLLPRVSPSAKFRATINVSHFLIESEEPFRALGLVEYLPEIQQEYYFWSFFQMWARHDPVGVFESIDTLPTEQTVEVAAQVLTMFQETNPSLTELQMEKLANMLNKE